MKIITYGKQFVDKKDIDCVTRSLKGKLITTGSFVKKFEKNLKSFLKSKFALTCNSGTSAIFLAFKGINLKKDDVVIMPSINFIASYNVVKTLKAKIFLADVDPLSGQMTPQNVIECIKNNRIKKIKAILNMYMGGYPENVLEFKKLKKKFNCYLIEDSCHAFGAKYKIKKKISLIGSCKHSDISTFSLHPLKTITSGEGGVVTTNNSIIYKNMVQYRSHGIIRNKKKHWEYNINRPGQNFRLSDINCALGLSQLKKVDKFIAYRKKIFNYYNINFNNFFVNILSC